MREIKARKLAENSKPSANKKDKKNFRPFILTHSRTRNLALDLYEFIFVRKFFLFWLLSFKVLVTNWCFGLLFFGCFICLLLGEGRISYFKTERTFQLYIFNLISFVE